VVRESDDIAPIARFAEEADVGSPPHRRPESSSTADSRPGTVVVAHRKCKCGRRRDAFPTEFAALRSSEAEDPDAVCDGPRTATRLFTGEIALGILGSRGSTIVPSTSPSRFCSTTVLQAGLPRKSEMAIAAGPSSSRLPPSANVRHTVGHSAPTHRRIEPGYGCGSLCNEALRPRERPAESVKLQSDVVLIRRKDQ
jgi:hypothetical protein